MEMLNISPESVIHLRELLNSTENVNPDHAIRLYISGFGHFGPEWSLSLDVYEPELDECCDFDGMRVIIERELLQAVGGIDVQYESEGEGGGFLITARDPEFQALYFGGGCGCGGCGGCGDCGSCGGCGHDHDGCGCGHDHDDGECGCGHHHGDGGCGCGHHHED